MIKNLPSFLRSPYSYLNQPQTPFLTAILAWGSSGEICYQQSKNLSFIEHYLELNEEVKKDIGFYETEWTLLNFFWNNITVGVAANDNEIFNVSYSITYRHLK